MQNLRIIDKGGRPPKAFVREHILDILSKLRRAYPKQVYETYKKEMQDDNKQVSYQTIWRNMEKMATEDGPLKRIQLSKSDKYGLFLYELRMEREVVL